MNPFKIAMITIPAMHLLGAWMVMSSSPTQETLEIVEDRVRVGGATIASAVVEKLPVSETVKESAKKMVSTAYANACTHKAPAGFSTMVESAAKRYGVNPRAIAITVYRESGCNPKMVGSSGEIGLGQVMPSIWTSTLRKENIIRESKDLFDPQTNLYATAWILRHLKKSHGPDPYTVFMRYNGSGPLARAYASAQILKYRSLWGMNPSI